MVINWRFNGINLDSVDCSRIGKNELVNSLSSGLIH